MKRMITMIVTSALCLSIFLLPRTADAETLKDYQNLLAKYQEEVKNAQDGINHNNAEIKAIEQQIASIKKEISSIAETIAVMRKEIEKSNEEIKQKSLQTKELFQYLQIANGENVYLEYAFGANDITDLIYRMAIVEQMTEYNDKVIKELEDLIAKNKKKEVDLKAREKEISIKQQSLSQKSKSIGEANVTLNQSSISAQGQVKIYQDTIKRYQDAGCQPNDVIGVDCAKTVSASGFYRPITQGYATSEFGWRWGVLHQGIDLSNSNPYNTKIYPVADGVITSKYIDSYGALEVGIEHYYNGKYYTSIYFHMSSYAPNLYVGKKVTTNDYIGYMGETGYAFGPHLHLEIADCRVFNLADKNCGRWSNYVSYLERKEAAGSKGPRDLIYFPTTWQWFYSRT